MGKRIAMVAYTQLRYDSRVIREAQAAVEAGFAVDFFTLKETDPVPIPGVRVISSSSLQFRGSSKITFIINYLKFFLFCTWAITLNHIRKKYHVIHVNNMPNFLVFSCIIPRISGSKLMLDIHDLVPELYAEKFQLPLEHLLIKLLYLEERWSARFCHVVLSTNKLHNERFVKNKIKKSDFPIILNASDESIFKPCPVHDFYQDPVVIIFPSTIAHRLGLDILVEAMEHVCAKTSNVELRLFGDGEYTEELIALIKSKGLQDHVKYLGLIDHQQLSREYDQAHIGVIPWPSNYSTNYQMPIKINEYFTKGLAVVASDVKILKVYFSDKALFYKAGDAKEFSEKILHLIENRALMSELSHKGHQFYLENTWTLNKNKYQGILQSLATK